MLYSVLVRLMGCTALASVAEWDEGNGELAKDGVCVGGGGGECTYYSLAMELPSYSTRTPTKTIYLL